MEAEAMVERLEKLLPRQMFELKIQAKTGGRIIASRRKSAMKKDVTQHMYGGDITRKNEAAGKAKEGQEKDARPRQSRHPARRVPESSPGVVVRTMPAPVANAKRCGTGCF